MTQDEIIRMAREAGCDNYGDCYEFVPETLERFAALVAAHERRKCEQEMSLMEEHCAELILIEREACAKVCDEYADKCVEVENWEAEDVSQHCAAAIRARSE